MINAQIINGRWRGIMPFRKNANLLTLQRRTGEPSPATIIHGYEGSYPPGWGMAEGSYTEKMRQVLWSWMEAKYGSYLCPLSFDYKLHRKQTITVTGEYPNIKHLPEYGNGKRGFVLEIRIISINGLAFTGLRRQHFAWNRIIGKERFLALPPRKEK